MNDDEPTRLTATVYASSPNNNDEVRGRMDRQAMMRRHRQSHGPTDRPALPEGSKRRGESIRRLAPPKAAPRPSNAEQEEWSSYDKIQHTSPTHDRGAPHTHSDATQRNSSHLWTGHIVALCDQPQPTAPTSGGRAPARGREAEDLVEVALPTM